MKTPVLFLVFNRPGPTARVFDAIRRAAPERLYVAADGPRREDERIVCEKAREAATAVDWPCHVTTLFREKNMGCKMAVSSALSWFFENEEEGVILEDDCLPDPTFFDYCAQLLDRYRSDDRIMHIGGTNFQEGRNRGASYYFSKYAHVWGWASWRRAWARYDREMSGFPVSGEAVIKNVFPDAKMASYWIRTMRVVHGGEVDTWDYQWLYSIWSSGGLSIIPGLNLVSNIGFGDSSTHTPDMHSRFSRMPVAGLPHPLSHPEKVAQHHVADEFTFYHHYRRSLAEKVINRLRTLLK